MRSNLPKQFLPLLIAGLLCLQQTALAKVPLAEIGKNQIKLEVAQTQKEIERGLMFRTSMPEDQGMVFLFKPPRKTRFWMYNCRMALDMLFIRDGKIIKICKEVPPCKSQNPTDCPTYPEDGEIEVSEVLELNPGYCARHNVKEGDSVRFSLPGFKSSGPQEKQQEKAEESKESEESRK